MIRFKSAEKLKTETPPPLEIAAIGVGGAGNSLLDRLALDGMDKDRLISVNTDVQALASCMSPKKIQLGRSVTRGLGAGGDPVVGLEAAQEEVEAIKSLLENQRLVFLCAGLGGGTGSGALPLIAKWAREAGALVFAFVTLPFSFEGRRRMNQALDALDALKDSVDAVVCFENDRMAETVSAKAGVHEAFATTDIIVSQSIRSVQALAQRPGLIAIGLDDLMTALRSQDTRCLFGFGEAEGDNRAQEALAQALRSPLMNRGRLLEETDNVLVSIAGGGNLSLAEVQLVMEALSRHVSRDAQILFGTAVDEALHERLNVTIISSIRGPNAGKEPERREQSGGSKFQLEPKEPEQVEEEEPPPASETKPQPQPESEPAPQPASRRRKKPAKTPKEQAAFQFEPVSRGRFDKSEPTIVDGEDLDVPTFMRKNRKF